MDASGLDNLRDDLTKEEELRVELKSVCGEQQHTTGFTEMLLLNGKNAFEGKLRSSYNLLIL